LKVIRFGILAAGLLACSIEWSYAQLTLNFANLTDNVIQFNGASHTFDFTASGAGYQWSITSENGGSSAIGLFGSVTQGPFTYGSITTVGSVQSASVLSPFGTLTINDGTGNLTGTVDWIDISTFKKAAGFFNADLSINLTSVVYSGTNPDLQFLALKQPGTLDLTFQFLPGMSLTDLSTGTGPYTTSYSGSISVVPEPSVLALAALGALSLLYSRRK